MATGLLAIEAAKAAREGMGLTDLTDMVRNLVPRTHVLITVNTVKYLVRGGHGTKTKVLLSSALRINPLVEIEGEILPFGKTFGRARAIEALCKYAAKFSPPRGLAVDYATDIEEAKSLASRLQQMFPDLPIHISRMSTVVGAHTGPGAVGISILEK
jgi:DegV family protein with EDD domain